MRAVRTAFPPSLCATDPHACGPRFRLGSAQVDSGWDGQARINPHARLVPVSPIPGPGGPSEHMLLTNPITTVSRRFSARRLLTRSLRA